MSSPKKIVKEKTITIKTVHYQASDGKLFKKKQDVAPYEEKLKWEIVDDNRGNINGLTIAQAITMLHALEIDHGSDSLIYLDDGYNDCSIKRLRKS